MKKPEMILFDYGQTLIWEQPYDGVKGAAALLRHATANKYNLTAGQVAKESDALNMEFGRFDPKKRHLFQIEIPTSMFTPYLYESLGIRLSLSVEESDTLFWDAACPAAPAQGIKDVLAFLQEKGVRTGVISNISYMPSVVAARINRLLPQNAFEFIMTSSNYVFRKPNRRIFDLALEKAALPPQDVWYIGDQYACDIVGAKSAGLIPVWYTERVNEQERARYQDAAREDAVHTVSSWTEFLHLVKEWI